MSKADPTGDHIVLIADERHIEFLRAYFDDVIVQRLRNVSRHTASLADPYGDDAEIARLRQWIADLDRGVIVGEPDVLATRLSAFLADQARSHDRFEDDHEPFAHLLRQLPSG